jgi:glycosyltransferase involved in cell wall biosynthesis
LRYLMVSTYPPTRCGIGVYGEQSVAQLRAQGHVVDIVSPDRQGNVDFAWDLHGGTKLLRLFQLLAYYDRVVMQYHWAFFYRDPFVREHRWEALQTTLCFVLLFLRCRKLEVVAHEVPYISGKQGWLYKWKWRLAPRVIFHTAKECERFEQHYGIRLNRSRVEFRSHDDVYQKFVEHTQHSARQQLKVSSPGLIFLCIGFIQRHKGFHRAVRAFVESGVQPAELFIVGSLRVPDSENQTYLAELYELTAPHSNIHLIESFVSNEDFDTWIAASDCVVLPYSEIWSSAVLGRTQLLNRPAIVSAVGGLPDQACEHDIVFSTNQELVGAFRTFAERFGRNSVSAKRDSKQESCAP